MSIEDPRLSSIDNTSAANDFDSAVEQHLGFVGEASEGIEVAQAETPDAGRTDRLPAQTPPAQTAAATIPTEVTPNAENVVTLPAGIELDNLEFQVDGDNLILVLADGTEIVVIGGAANIPTFVIGEVELPQVALFAALEGSNINVAAGPDGTFSAQAGSPSNGGDFNDDPFGPPPEDLGLADLLGDTDFGDELRTGTVLGDDGEPSISPLIALTNSFIYDEAAITPEILNDRVISGRLPFNPGPDFGAISSVAFTGAGNVNEEGGGGSSVLSAFTSGGRPITVTSLPAPTDGADVDFVAIEGRDSAGNLVFTLTITDRTTGDFTFELIGKLEHPDVGQNGSQDDLDDLLRLGFTYTVTDLDGDFVVGTFNIDIQDDAPTIGTPVAGSIDEAGVDFNEGPGPEKLVAVLADGPVGPESPEPQLKPVVANSLGIRWGADDDFKNEDVEDGNLNDDDPVGRTVSFTGLTQNSTSEQIIAAIPVLNGLRSDGIELRYEIRLTYNTQGNWNGGYELVAFKDYGYEGGGEEPGVQEARFYEGDYTSDVFIITLDPTTTNGTYTFQLIGNLDHYTPVAPADENQEEPPVDLPPSDGLEVQVFLSEDTANSKGEQVDVLEFKIPFTATDSDGDSVSGTVTVNVQDDKPVFSGETIVATIDEDDIETKYSTGTSPRDGADEDKSYTGETWFEQPGPATVSGHLDSLVDFGADSRWHDARFSIDDTPEVLNTLSKLTSNGDPISYAVLFGTLYGYVDNPEGGPAFGEDDRVVFTLEVSSSGSYSFKLFGQLDHVAPGSGADENLTLRPGITTINFGAVIKATDYDDDSITLGNAFSIQVRDDVPVAKENTLIQLDDDVLTGGIPGGPSDDVETAVLTGTLGHEAGADGVESILWANDGIEVPFGFWFERSADGKTMTITQNQGGGEDNYVAVFQAVITDTLTGAYEIVQLAPVKHAEGTIPGTEDNRPNIAFQYLVTDGDGDTARGTISFNVDDDTPTVDDNAVIQLDDDALAGGIPGGTGDAVETAVLTGTLAHKGGADGTASVLWAPDGIDVPFGFWFELSTDGKTMTITQNQGEGEDNYVAVFKAVITDSLTGAYEITQLAPVKHGIAGTEDNAEVSFQYRVTDGDGDVATGKLTVNIDDDTPVAKTVEVARQLDDEAQTVFKGNDGANWPFGGSDVSTNRSSVSGNAGTLFSAGADGLKSVSIVGPAFAVVFKDAQGFAQTEEVEWDSGTLAEDGSTIFVATSENYGAPEGAAVLRIGADGSYTFTMKAPLAHPEQKPLVSGFEEEQTLRFEFTVVDGDGDTSSGSLSIKVDDDTPEPLVDLTITAALDDEAQTEFTPVNPGGSRDVPDDIKMVSGGKGSLFKMGADGLSEISVGLPAFSVLGRDDNGFAVEQSANWGEGVRSAGGVTTFKATVGGGEDIRVVAELIIRADGSYKFTLNAPVAHSISSVREDNTELVFTYTVTDGDGDKAVGAIVISVDDDTPVAKTLVNATDLLQDPNTPLTSTATGLAGSLFTAGADGVKSVSISGGAFDVFYKQAGVTLSEAVKWGEGTQSEDGATTFVATGAVSGQEAAVLKINTDGSYSFALKAPIVHTGGNAVDKTISIGFEVIDGDGDKDRGQLSLTVRDGVPTATPSTTVWLDDEDLAGGNFGGLGDYPGTPVNPINTVNFSFGADKVGASISWLASSFVHSPAQGFTFEVEDGGKTLFVKQFGALVYTAVINQETGKYAITQNGVVKHPVGSNENDVIFQLMYEVKDGDGDTAQSYLWVKVDDDTPTANDVVVSSSALNDGAGAQVNGVAGALFSAGADGLKSVSISGGAFEVYYKQAGLSVSEGVKWGEGFKSETGTTTFVAKGAVSGQDAALLKINADGSYSFELKAPIVHKGESAGDKTISIGFEVIDGDGDKDTGQLSLTVKDGVPSASPSTTVWLDDEDLAGGNPGGIGDYANTPENAKGTVNFSFGADKLGASISWLASSFVHSPAKGFTFEVEDGGKTLLVKQFGVLVYTAVIEQETGKYTVTQNGVIQHPPGSNENEAIFQLMYEVKDGDGDTAQSYLWVKVDDDTPIANNVVVSSGSIEDLYGAEAVAEAGALFSAGADGLKSISISGGAFDVRYRPEGSEVAFVEGTYWSSGEKSANGSTTFVAKGIVSGQEAAVLTINKDGSYSFELQASVPENENTEDSQVITIDFQVTDGDGDSAKGTLEITVGDDDILVPYEPEDGEYEVETYSFDFDGDHVAAFFVSDETHHLTFMGTDGPDVLHGGMGEVVMTGGAGADAFVFDATALDELDVADVITDFNSSEGDVLDVTALLDSLLGEQATAETAASHIRATVDDGNTTVSVQTAPDTWKDVVVLQNHDTAIKVLFDDKHATITPHD